MSLVFNATKQSLHRAINQFSSFRILAGVASELETRFATPLQSYDSIKSSIPELEGRPFMKLFIHKLDSLYVLKYFPSLIKMYGLLNSMFGGRLEKGELQSMSVPECLEVIKVRN